jgi:hypothetical protein
MGVQTSHFTLLQYPISSWKKNPQKSEANAKANINNAFLDDPLFLAATEDG